MRLRRIMAATLSAVALSGGIAVVAPSAAQADGNVGAFLNHLNSLRAANGLPALALVGDLSAVAQAHSEAMAAQGTIFHNGSLTTDVTNWQTVGENVGMGPSEAAIDNAFDNSPGHYANEVNSSYTQVGIGSVTRSDGQIFVTLDFRRPMNASSSDTPAASSPQSSSGGSSSSSSSGSSRSSGSTQSSAAAQAAAQAAAAAAAQAAAEAQAAADAAAAQAAARAAARAAADQQAAALTQELRTSTDPLANAMVFAAHVNTLGQTG